MKKLSMFIFIIAASIVATEARAQALADVARQERARQSKTESKISLTNDHVAAGPGQSIATVPPVAKDAGKPAVAAKPAGPTDNKGRDEKYWREAFRDARAILQRAEAEMQVLELDRNKLNTELLRGSDIYNREYRIAAEMNSKNAEINTARRQVDAARQRIADLEEELRRSGGPPGWSR